MSAALVRLARTAGIAALLLVLAGCQSSLEVPRTAATASASATAGPTAPLVTRPPVASRTALPAVTAPPLASPPPVNPALLNGGSSASAGRGGSGSAAHRGSVGSHGGSGAAPPAAPRP